MGCEKVVKDAYRHKPLKATEVSDNLFEAVLRGDVSSVKKWIRKGADLSLYDAEGYTVLARSVQVNNFIMTEDVLRGGAKIFQPLQNNIEKSPYTETLDYSKQRIKDLFEREKERLSSELELRINNLDFKGALRYSRANYLPVSLKLPLAQKSIFEVTISKISEIHNDTLYEKSSGGQLFADQINYLKYLIDGDQRGQAKILFHHGEVFLKISSVFRDLDFLKYIIKQFNVRHVRHKFENLTSEDAKNLSWMIEKTKVLGELGYSPNLEGIRHQILNYDISLNPDSKSKSQYISLIQILSRHTQEEKGEVASYTLMSLIEKCKENSEYLKWVISVIKVWKDQNILDEVNTFDFYAIEILKSIESNPFVFEEIKETLNHLYSFAPSTPNNNVRESIEFIITGDFKDYQREGLLSQVLEKTNSLPDGILSFAIDSGKAQFLKILLEPRATLQSFGNQETVVFSAVQPHLGMDSSYSILEFLNERKISFNTQSGVQAIDFILDRVIIQGDLSYQDILAFMLNIERTILYRMNSEKVLFYLSKQLENIRSGKSQDWNLISKILNKTNLNLGDTSYILPLERLPEDLKGNLQDTRQDLSLKVSFSWEYILTLFEAYKAHPEQLTLRTDSFSFIKVLEIFPKDHFSMSFEFGEESVNSKSSIIQDILPLSILFSIEKNKIKASLSNPHIDNRRYIYPLTPDTISWTIFLNNPIFQYYSQHPQFWKHISKVLLGSGRKVFSFREQPTSIVDKSFVKYLKILASTGQFIEYPELERQIGKLNIKLPDEHKTCVMVSKVSESCPTCITSSHGVSQVQLTNLGTFEALVHLKEKTCHGKRLHRKELSFIEKYIQNNMSSFEVVNLVLDFQRSRDTVADLLSKVQTEKSIACGSIPIDEDLKNGWTYSFLGNLNLYKNPNSPPLKQDLPLTSDQKYRFIQDISSKSSFDQNNFKARVNSSNPDYETLSPFAQCSVFKHVEDIQYRAKKIFLNQWSKCALATVDETLVRYFETISEKIATDSEFSNSNIQLCKF